MSPIRTAKNEQAFAFKGRRLNLALLLLAGGIVAHCLLGAARLLIGAGHGVEWDMRRQSFV